MLGLYSHVLTASSAYTNELVNKHKKKSSDDDKRRDLSFYVTENLNTAFIICRRITTDGQECVIA